MIRLPDFLLHPGLNAVRQRMRADLVEYREPIGRGRRISIRDLRALETTGIQIDPADVETLRDGTFTYQGERVLLYIYQPYHTLPRYHLCNCPTWDDMKAKGRHNRYVASRRIDGQFEVDLTARDGKVSRQTVPLDVCQRCLNHLAWNGFASDLRKAERRKRVRDFSLADFFQEKRASLVREKPKWTPETMPSASYSDDFDVVSSAARKEAGWRCSECKRLFARSWQRRYLHTHHRNGVKGDNSPQNLHVLCLYCHANEPHHERMKHIPQYKTFMALFGEPSTIRSGVDESRDR